MIGVAMFTTIKTLWEKHKKKTVIAELTGHDWKTVSKVVKMIESGAGYPDNGSTYAVEPLFHRVGGNGLDDLGHFLFEQRR